ncbi:MAG: class F sortase [Dehalococcoidia bacterium]|nr:class F sortase [Dehalococcoidia bacterium]
MKTLRVLAVVSFVAGLALLAYGFVANQDGGDTSAAEPVPTTFDLQATPTPTLTTEPEATPTATPTPPPYDGAVTLLKIPQLEVSSKIENIGLLPDNRLDVPHDPYNTGWYDIYDKPGFGGNAVFSAHVDYYPNIIGPFNKLATLRPDGDDEIVIQMEDGREYRYVVIRVTRYDANNIPMGDIIWPQNKPEGEEWITLITCGGELQRLYPGGPGTYLQRDVVVARRVIE